MFLNVALPDNLSQANLPIQYFLVQIDNTTWIWIIRIVVCISFIALLIYYKYVKAKIDKRDLDEKDKNVKAKIDKQNLDQKDRKEK